jgi:hypothetical protein
MNIIPFNSLVEDVTSGFRGFVVARLEYMNNCIRYALQPPLEKGKELGEPITVDGGHLKIIKPPKGGQAKVVETPNAFKLGVKLKDRLSGLTGIAVVRLKHRHSGDRYGLQPPINKEKGKIPDLRTFEEEDLEQIDPPPVKKAESIAKKPNGPHSHGMAITR